MLDCSTSKVNVLDKSGEPVIKFSLSFMKSGKKDLLDWGKSVEYLIKILKKSPPNVPLIIRRPFGMTKSQRYEFRENIKRKMGCNFSYVTYGMCIAVINKDIYKFDKSDSYKSEYGLELQTLPGQPVSTKLYEAMVKVYKDRVKDILKGISIIDFSDINKKQRPVVFCEDAGYIKYINRCLEILAKKNSEADLPEYSRVSSSSEQVPPQVGDVNPDNTPYFMSSLENSLIVEN